MGQRDRIDRLVDRLAEMPAVEQVEPLAEGICDRISIIQRRLMLRHKRSLDRLLEPREISIAWPAGETLGATTRVVISAATRVGETRSQQR